MVTLYEVLNANKEEYVSDGGQIWRLDILIDFLNESEEGKDTLASEGWGILDNAIQQDGNNKDIYEFVEYEGE